MLDILNCVTPSADQWMAIITGMRSPLNSWDKGDSNWIMSPKSEDVEKKNGRCVVKEITDHDYTLWGYIIGDADRELMNKLMKSGPDHRKFMRMIPVYLEINAPMYWWKEMDTYKVGTVRNSCSTMHKLMSKPFELTDFSTDQMMSKPFLFNIGDRTPLDNLKDTIEALNTLRDLFLKTEDKELKKKYWYSIIQLLPSSYNQRATIFTNYETLTKMYHGRKNHKLYEWRTFCKYIQENLPLSELITGETE